MPYLLQYINRSYSLKVVKKYSKRTTASAYFPNYKMAKFVLTCIKSLDGLTLTQIESLSVGDIRLALDVLDNYLCEKCKKICPREGINIPLLIINLRNESFKKGFGPRYSDLRKYVEMSERFLTSGIVVEESLGQPLSQQRIDEIDEICNFARIKYVFKASKKKNRKKKIE